MTSHSKDRDCQLACQIFSQQSHPKPTPTTPPFTHLAAWYSSSSWVSGRAGDEAAAASEPAPVAEACVAFESVVEPDTDELEDEAEGSLGTSLRLA